MNRNGGMSRRVFGRRQKSKDNYGCSRVCFSLKINKDPPSIVYFHLYCARHNKITNQYQHLEICPFADPEFMRKWHRKTVVTAPNINRSSATKSILFSLHANTPVLLFIVLYVTSLLTKRIHDFS